MSIRINTLITPTFTAIGPLCQNSIAPALPLTSTNGVTGTWSPATISTLTAGTFSYTFTPTAGQCASSTNISVTISTQIIPVFVKVEPLCQNSTAPALPLTSTNGVTGTWSPATISTLTAGTFTFTFTPTSGLCSAIVTMIITVNAPAIPGFTSLGIICQDDNAPVLPTSSLNGITGTWNPVRISTAASSAGTKTYTFTPESGQCAIATTMAVTVKALTKPLFTNIDPICQNTPAPLLPTISINGINGTWDPEVINTSIVTQPTYKFTATTGQCTETTTMEVKINGKIDPVFDPIGPFCLGSTATALPEISANGITGTWYPATISTAALGSTTYSFSPNADQCAWVKSIVISIVTKSIPELAQIGPICQNSIAPVLPLKSVNGIYGKWSPATISTANAGKVTYTFTPDNGQCAEVGTMDIEIIESTTPTFGIIKTLCQNSTPPVLPVLSTNGITGTWSPATINTTTSGTATYTFMPDPNGQCANPVQLDITIIPQTMPLFTAIGPLCRNSAAPLLPLTSTNGITGTWSPQTIITSTAGTKTYIFTPASDQCAKSTTMTIRINSPITPVFSAIGPMCQNSTPPLLPLTSTNGVTGTWIPATINTAIDGTSDYTFIPTPGQCANTGTLAISITKQTTPLFTAIGPLCLNSAEPALPAKSINGISGTWNPAQISTAKPGTTVYTFTPSAGQCATTGTITVTIEDKLIPTFTAVEPLCQQSIAPQLPLTSTNGITGEWNPVSINTADAGTSTYTFTPGAGQCAVPASMVITVNPQLTPAFAEIGPICQNSTAPNLPNTSTNGFAGIWKPSAINTADSGNATYTFTPNAGQCATKSDLMITITPMITPTFAAVGPICQNSLAPVLPVVSANGVRGKWNPATVTTNMAGSFTYTFTPEAGECATSAVMSITVNPVKSSATQVTICSNQLPYIWNKNNYNTAGNYSITLVTSKGCDSIATLNLSVVKAVTPTFNQIGPLMQNVAAPALPANSVNGITGVWNPANINMAITGITNYLFTPDANQCATSASMDINIQIDAVISGLTLTGLCEQSRLDASRSVGDIVKYEWSLLDQGGTLSQETGINTDFLLSPNYTGPLPADFRVKLEVTNRNGLSTSDTITITVDPAPVAEVNSSGKLEKDGSMVIDGSVSTGADIKYQWSTTEGKIIGPDNQSTARLFGAGIYKLEVSDIHGCLDSKSFKYPLEFHQIVANPDYARVGWNQDTTINVLDNDHSTVYLRPGTVTVTEPATRGGTKVNANGSITYTPRERHTETDKFVYEVCDTLDFCASATVTIDIYDNGLKIPEAFSPNGDGANDKLVFTGLIENYPKSELYVFTRSGQLVHESTNYLNDWGGTTINSTLTNLQLVPTGTYYYVLKLGGTNRAIKGFVYIGY
jgi:gliding motility-associated-like protein